MYLVRYVGYVSVRGRSSTPVPIYDQDLQDPVTVHIYLNGADINNLTNQTVVSLFDIQPCRVIVLIDRVNDYLSMMRIEGMDIF